MRYLSGQKIIIFTITAVIFFIVSAPVLAAGKYIPLEYLPGAGQPNQPVDLQTYSSALLRIGVILAAILAVITITIGGIRYITAGSSLNSIEEARNMIKQALIGLFVVLFSYLLLYTINPDILKNGLNIKSICGTGFMWEESSNKCAQKPTGTEHCASGAVWDPASSKCVPETTHHCVDGPNGIWDPTIGKCLYQAPHIPH